METIQAKISKLVPLEEISKLVEISKFAPLTEKLRIGGLNYNLEESSTTIE